MRPYNLNVVDDVLVARLGAFSRRIAEVPVVDAFVQLIFLHENLHDINCVHLHIICDSESERHQKASYSKTWRGEKLLST